MKLNWLQFSLLNAQNDHLDKTLPCNSRQAESKRIAISHTFFDDRCSGQDV